MEQRATSFWRPGDEAQAQSFMDDGVVVFPAEDRSALNDLQGLAASLAARHLGQPTPADPEGFLLDIHKHVSTETLNDLRLTVMKGINAEAWTRPAYFSFARSALEVLVGNELAMQLRLNLSVQLPGDDSSILPVHADVWNGDSAFEVVLWVPLVSVKGTQCMFLLPPEPNARHAETLSTCRSSEDLYKRIEPDLRWMEMPFGSVMIFSQNLMHGNRVNREAGTRWSMNCRFKGLFTPYADKRLGEFFEPITLRPATRLGAAHRQPGGFLD